MTGFSVRIIAVLVLACAGIVATFAPARAAEPLAALDARLGGDSERTRLIIDLTQTVEATHFLLADPYRVVIDLPQTEFRFPANIGRQGQGLVSAFRYGLIAAGRSRIVIDVTRAVSVEKIFTIDPAEGQPARLVIDLQPTTPEKFMAAMSLRGALPQERAALPPPAAAGDHRPVVVIDPGHGGVDPGAASSTGISEKDVVLGVARRLRDKLERAGRYRVIMTRDDDTFIALGDRVRIAREANAALFISIHADSLSVSAGVRGATVYTLSDRASDAEAARLADKENRADAIAGVELPEELDDVAGILIDLMQRETRTFSSRLSSTLVNALRSEIRMNRNPQRSAGFRVLRAPDVPSALIELGYMSSPQDVQLLTSEEWRDRATSALVKAIDSFFEARVAAGHTVGVN